MSGADITASSETALPRVQPRHTAPIAEDLLAQALEPYSYKGCRYLLDAEYGLAADSVTAHGNFSIGDSAYIRSTGHFNAVELTLCFNQLAYTTFAHGTANGDISAFRGWSVADYCHHQLSSMLIKSASSRFRRPIDANRFSAALYAHDFQIVERAHRCLRFQNIVEFWDQSGGSATGAFEIVVINIPNPPAASE